MEQSIYKNELIGGEFNLRKIGDENLRINTYAVHSAKEKAKFSVSDFRRGMVQEQQNRQSGRMEKQEQYRKNIADKRIRNQIEYASIFVER